MANTTTEAFLQKKRKSTSTLSTNEEPTQIKTVNLTTLANICFIVKSKPEIDNNAHKDHDHDHDHVEHFLQGYLIDPTTRKSFGLMATPSQAFIVLDCCYSKDDPPSFFEVTVIDYENNTEFVEDKVEKLGGDFIRLSSPHLSFQTDTVKTDKEAQQYITKLFPKLQNLDYDDAFICIGKLELKEAQFQPPVQSNKQHKSYGSDEDNEIGHSSSSEEAAQQPASENEANDSTSNTDNSFSIANINPKSTKLVFHDDDDFLED